MPYIKQKHRKQYDEQIDAIIATLLKSNENEVPGHLNYIVSKIITHYLLGKGRRYYRINALLGALTCAQMEVYRRVAAPYENQAIDTNGDI